MLAGGRAVAGSNPVSPTAGKGPRLRAFCVGGWGERGVGGGRNVQGGGARHCGPRRDRGCFVNAGTAPVSHTPTLRRPAMSFPSGPSRCAYDADRRDEKIADGQRRGHGREPEGRLTMTIVISAFERSPDGGKGLARDTRVRWALEEVGQPYDVRLVSFRAKKEPAHLRLHPFGLIPTYEEGELALFETGAIVFHIAEHHAGLFPDDADARARAITWMFAALNTVEPPILELVTARFAEGDKPWADELLPLVKDRIRERLVQLSARLGDADWLDGAFSAGDLMMVSVLLRLRPSGLLDEFSKLAAYVARGEARPAYKRAFAAQLAINAR